MPGREYAIARVRGLRGRLLGQRGVVELLAQPDLAARLELLKKTDYATALPPGPAAGMRDVVRGLGRGFVRDAARVRALLDVPRLRAPFDAVIALRDVYTLKTILRGVNRGEPSHRLLGLLDPTPAFDDGALRELVAQRDVKGVVDLLATWGDPHAAPLADALPAYRRDHDLAPLETALDRAFFARALRAAHRRGRDAHILRGLVEEMIDLANAATLLRLPGRAPAQLHVPGGRALSAARFRALARLDAAALAAALAGDRALRLGAAFPDGRLHPFLLDRLIQTRPIDSLRRPARLHPLSIAVPLLYLLERQEELRRIRLVLEGTEVGLSAADMAALLEREA